MFNFKKSIVVFILVCMFVSNSFAFIGHKKADPEMNTVMDYGIRGFWTGITMGFAAGYINYIDNGDDKAALKGIAYGGIAGAGVGLVVGIIDLNSRYSGVGNIIIRDMNSGMLLGGIVGTCVGFINLLDTEQGKDLFLGASWGIIAGGVLGLVVGIYEGPKAAAKKYAYNPNNSPKLWVKSTDKGEPMFGCDILRRAF